MTSRPRWPVTAGLSIIIFAGLVCVVNENGFSQKPVNTQSSAQKKLPVNKAIISAGQNQVPAATSPTPTGVAMPLNFTLKSDKINWFQGQLVTFTLNPQPPRGYPYTFVLHFDDDRKDAFINYSPDQVSAYRFLTAGQHTVKVSPNALPIGTNIPLPRPTVSEASINVEKIPLNVGPLPGESGPPFVINQTIVFSTQDLHDRLVKYQYVVDGEKLKEDGPTASFTFKSDGTHSVYVNLLSTNNDFEPISSDSQDVMISLLPSDVVHLSADRSSQAVGQYVNFVASPDSTRLRSLHLNNQKLQYRFTYGDDGKRDWDESPNAAYRYPRAGNFEPYVEIRIANGAILAKSAVFRVTISAAPFAIDPTALLIVGVVIVTIGGTLLVYFIRKPPPKPLYDPTLSNRPSYGGPAQAAPAYPTIVFSTDENSPSLKQPRVSVNLRVRFNSGVRYSNVRLSSPQAGLIKLLRRRDV